VSHREPERSRGYGLVIGEAFVDLIAQNDERGRVYIPKFGGSPLNVAVGLRRLGTDVKLAATLTPGTFGTALREFCLREGMDIESLSTRVQKNFIAVATPMDRHVTYEYFGDLKSLTAIKSIRPEAVRRASIIHASSTALNADPARSTVREAYECATGFRTIDPNPRPSLIDDRDSYLKGLADLFGLVDLVKVSDEDCLFLFPHMTEEEAALTIHRTYGVTVIVTRADESTVLANADSLTLVTVPHIRVVDATGAGDSFMASLLADVAQFGAPTAKAGWVEYISRANIAAAATCKETGGAESMPTSAVLNRRAPDRNYS